MAERDARTAPLTSGTGTPAVASEQTVACLSQAVMAACLRSWRLIGIMGLSSAPLPMDRVHLVNPGQSEASATAA